MADEYTTVRVKKTTRDALNGFAEKYTTSPDEAIVLLLNSSADVTRQVLLTLPKPKHDALVEMTKLLYKIKAINFPTTECAVEFAIDRLIEGLQTAAQTAVPMAGKMAGKMAD